MSSIGWATLAVIPSAKDFGATLTKGIAPEMALAGKVSGDSFSKGMLKASAGLAAIGLGVGIVAVKMAANFQEATTQLVTGAGESEKSLKMIRDGLLAMAPAVGMGPVALAKAMFLVESAGFHGAAGLLVMKAAAEGAKIGGADATVVANGLTTALTDYHLPASMAATVTSKLAATVAAGKTNFQGLTGSLSAVLPAAAAAGVGLDQILGAVATMTGQGISADQATQNLANTIRSLQNPSQVASKTMAAMGLNSTTVAQQLGSRGLTGTLAELTGAITAHMGPAGLVLQSAFNQSALAAQSANIMLKNLPPSIQGLAKGFLDGTVTQKEWMKATRAMPALQGSLAKQFATTAKEAHGFNDSLKSGSGPAVTYSAILADMLGGATGLNTGLALTGPNMGTFTTNTTNIGKAAAETGGHVKGWKLTQEDLNVKLSEASGLAQSMAVRIGTALIPAMMGALEDGQRWTTWAGQHAAVTWTVVGALGAFATASIAVKVASLAAATASGVWTAATGIGTAAMWLWNTAALASRATTVALWAMYAADAIAGAVQTELAVGRIVVAWAVSSAASVASAIASAAAWVAQGARTIAIIAEITVQLAIQKIAMLSAQVVAAAVAVGTGIWTAAQWLLNAALTANPIGLVIVGIGLLIGAIVAVATKTTWFQTAWEYSTHAIGAAWQWLFNTILAPIFRMVLDGIGSIIGGISNLLMALGHIPHFEWATAAGNAMRGASDQAHAMANGIKDIPHTWNVDISFTSNYSQVQQQLLNLSNSANKLGAMAIHAASGGPVGGTGTSDSEPYMLTPKEFIVRRDGSNLGDALAYFGAKAGAPVGGGSGAGSDALLTEVQGLRSETQGLRSDVRGLVRSYQTMQRQYAR